MDEIESFFFGQVGITKSKIYRTRRTDVTSAAGPICDQAKILKWECNYR